MIRHAEPNENADIMSLEARFPSYDYRETAAKLRDGIVQENAGDGTQLKAWLSNRMSVILGALDEAAEIDTVRAALAAERAKVERLRKLLVDIRQVATDGQGEDDFIPWIDVALAETKSEQPR